MTKLKRMSWTGHVARMQGGEIVQDLGGNWKGLEHLEVLDVDGRIILK